MDERAFFNESSAKRTATLNCPWCRTQDAGYELNYIIRQKKDRLPGGADERDRAKFAKMQSYMLLTDTQAMCRNPRCRKRFDISGIKTISYL